MLLFMFFLLLLKSLFHRILSRFLDSKLLFSLLLLQTFLNNYINTFSFLIKFSLSINDATLLSLSDINILGTPSLYFLSIAFLLDSLNFSFDAKGKTL